MPRSVSALSLPSAPAMAREHSGGQAQGKRAATGRKQSPSNAGQDPPPQIQSDDPQNEVPRGEADESLEQLAERLKKVQQENEMTEKQICEEEAEHESTLKDLENQRDEAKQKVKERDEATNDLKRQVHKLETANRTAQTERTKKEKLLQQKEAERKKRQDDIDRWDQEASRMVEEVSQTKSDKSDIENEIKQQISDYRQKTCNEKNDIKALEEDIQDKGSQILKLEEERKRLVVGDDSEEAKEADRVEREKDRAWDLKLNSLQAKYTSMLATVNQVGQFILIYAYSSNLFIRFKLNTSRPRSDYAGLVLGELAHPDHICQSLLLSLILPVKVVNNVEPVNEAHLLAVSRLLSEVSLSTRHFQMLQPSTTRTSLQRLPQARPFSISTTE